jgi:ligand-binding sensor domain-containing protein/signal transduction histidine kinase
LTSFNSSHDVSKRLKRLRCGWLLTLTAVCFAHLAHAVDSRKTFSQYIRDQWSAENGFPGGFVRAFTQTPDGYLWVGAAKGLYRFDGLNFVTAQALDPAFPSITNILGLTTDGEGNLWVLTQGSVLRYRNGSFEDLTSDLAPGSFITTMSRALGGNVLLANLMQGEILYGRKRFTVLASSEIFHTALVISLAQTQDGKIWVGTRGNGLFYLIEGQLRPAIGGLPDRKINSLSATRNGVLWIGTDNGLAIWDGTAISTKNLPPALSKARISALMEDRDGNLWIGTSLGLLRFNNKDGSLLIETDKESLGEITALQEDREGNIWIGSNRGIERLRDSPFTTYSFSEGLPSERSGPIYVDPEARLWFAPLNGGLYCMEDGKVKALIKGGSARDVIYSITGSKNDVWVGRQTGGLMHFALRQGAVEQQTYTEVNGLAQNSVYGVHESRDGTVWAGTLSGGVSRLKDGTFTAYTTSNGLASNSIAAIEEGAEGTMWFATRGGLNAWSRDRVLTYTVHDGLPSDDVISLLSGSDGALWIGTAGGLAFFSANKIHGAQVFPESLREPIFGLAEDRQGSLWIATSDRVLKVNRDRLLTGDLKAGDIREYGFADGLRGIEGVRRDRSVVIDQRGRIWFSLNRGISVVDPARVSAALPAIPHVEKMSADGIPITMQEPIRVPGPSRRLVFTYTGVTLTVPERVRFRYMLEGFDQDWNDVTATRQAIYTNLDPGSYSFRVKASNSDELWDGPEAAVSLKIAPAFWQARWFQVSYLLSLALIVWMIYQLRVRQLSRQMRARFEERLEERERIARDLHDTLLQGFVSAAMQLHVANDRLETDSPAKPIVERVVQLMRQVSEEGRNTIRSLRSSKHATPDIEQALSRVGQEFGEDGPVDFRVVAEGLPQALHPAIRDEAYRIGREAVTNAYRHSGASRIEVEVDYATRRLRILVRDNGCGINAQVLQSGREGHWGLPGMQERAEKIGAKLVVSSGSGIGTEVELSIPGNVAYVSFSSGRWPKWLGSVLRKSEYKSSGPQAGSKK